MLHSVEAILGFLVQRGITSGPRIKFDMEIPDKSKNFVQKPRAARTAAGYPEKKYAGHSFRIGAVTMAAQCGKEDSLIKTLGRWEKLSLPVLH